MLCSMIEIIKYKVWQSITFFSLFLIIWLMVNFFSFVKCMYEAYYELMSYVLMSVCKTDVVSLYTIRYVKNK